MSSRPWDIRSPSFTQVPSFLIPTFDYFMCFAFPNKEYASSIQTWGEWIYFFLNGIPVLHIIGVNICWKYAKILCLPWCFFKPLKNLIITTCSYSSWEQSDGGIRFHTVYDTEPETGCCRVRICLSPRNDLRLPDQFWQVTDSVCRRKAHMWQRTSREFTRISQNPLTLTRVKLLTTLVCGGSWFSC